MNTEINNLKSSVSNGKATVASAITDKGVSTSATDTFNTMASNIRSIKSGGFENIYILVNIKEWDRATTEQIKTVSYNEDFICSGPIGGMDAKIYCPFIFPININDITPTGRIYYIIPGSISYSDAISGIYNYARGQCDSIALVTTSNSVYSYASGNSSYAVLANSQDISSRAVGFAFDSWSVDMIDGKINFNATVRYKCSTASASLKHCLMIFMEFMKK